MKNPVKNSTLFLTELILDLFIFVLCAAACTGLLIKAHSMSRESRLLTQAVYCAQSIAEEWKATGSAAPQSDLDGQGLTQVLRQEGAVLDISIQTEDGREIYALEGVTYLG